MVYKEDIVASRRLSLFCCLLLWCLFLLPLWLVLLFFCCYSPNAGNVPGLLTSESILSTGMRLGGD
jgi:hypothetical protein